MENRRYTLDLQVWRPSPTVHSTGCYSLVGKTRFTSIELTNQVAFVTPLSGERIHFQPGDVVGFSVVEARKKDHGVVALRDREDERDGGYETETVWYGDEADRLPDPDCPYPIGTAGVLSTSMHAAPVVSPLYSELQLLAFIV